MYSWKSVKGLIKIPTWTRARITAWIVGSDGEWDLGSLGKDMSSMSISVASFSLCRLSQCLAEPVVVRGGKETGFGALWLCWKILLTSSGGRRTGRREDMWVRKANSRSLLREVISEARKGREGQGDWEERMLDRKDLRDRGFLLIYCCFLSILFYFYIWSTVGTFI